jgi:WD40 repeat protein
MNKITTLCYSHDSKYVYSNNWDPCINVWEVKSWKHFKTLLGHTGIVETIEHSLCG